MGARVSRNKVEWLDSGGESFDPRDWGGKVPKQVAGRLTPTRVRAIRQLFHSGNFTQTELAEMFHTTGQTINHVVRRQTWKWL